MPSVRATVAKAELDWITARVAVMAEDLRCLLFAPTIWANVARTGWQLVAARLAIGSLDGRCRLLGLPSAGTSEVVAERHALTTCVFVNPLDRSVVILPSVAFWTREFIAIPNPIAAAGPIVPVDFLEMFFQLPPVDALVGRAADNRIATFAFAETLDRPVIELPSPTDRTREVATEVDFLAAHILARPDDGRVVCLPTPMRWACVVEAMLLSGAALRARVPLQSRRFWHVCPALRARELRAQTHFITADFAAVSFPKWLPSFELVTSWTLVVDAQLYLIAANRLSFAFNRAVIRLMTPSLRATKVSAHVDHVAASLCVQSAQCLAAFLFAETRRTCKIGAQTGCVATRLRVRALYRAGLRLRHKAGGACVVTA